MRIQRSPVILLAGASLVEVSLFAMAMAPIWSIHLGELSCIFLFLLGSGWLYLHFRHLARK